MTPRRRPVLLLSLLGFAMGASAWVTYMPEYAADAVVVPVTPPVHRKSGPTAEKQVSTSGTANLALDRLQRPSMAVGDADPFNAKSWYVAPPVAPQAPTVVPAPTAPPLPFTYMGKLEGEDGWVVYLTKGEAFFSVTEGETFDGVYRLEGIENGNLVIQYLPLSMKQLLLIGEQS